MISLWLSPTTVIVVNTKQFLLLGDNKLGGTTIYHSINRGQWFSDDMSARSTKLLWHLAAVKLPLISLILPLWSGHAYSVVPRVSTQHWSKPSKAGASYVAQNNHLKLVGRLLNYEHYSILCIYGFPLEMYSKFVLPNWTLLSHILKWVGKWPVTDHYCEL